MKQILSLFFLFSINSCFAQSLPSHFIDYLWGRVSCTSIVDPVHHISYFTKYVGPSYKQEQGAFYFKLKQKANLFGSTVAETFVSDSTIPYYTFIGAIVDDTPDNLVKKLLESKKATYYPHKHTINEPYKTYYSYSGSTIVWAGPTQSKIFCLNNTYPWNFSNN